MVKASLSIILNYVMLVLLAPKRVLESIKKCRQGFIWKGNFDDNKKIALVSWDKMCIPTLSSAMGIITCFIGI